jgi:hypothetical protein
MIHTGHTTMKFISIKTVRTSLLAVVFATGMVACNRAADEPAAPEIVPTNTLLAHVPADTPFAIANLNTPPAEVIDAFVARFQPAMDILQHKLTEFRAGIDTSDDGDAEAKLVLALLDEFDGKLNRSGLESLGFSLEAHKVIYGIGAFPVLRVELANADALRAAVGRVETKSGMTLPTLESNGTAYWRLSDHDEDAGFYIAILDDQLVVSAFPVSAETELLPAFLGQTLPEASMATNNRIAKINQQRGYSGYGTGFIDLKSLFSQFTDSSSQTARFLADTDGFDPASLDAVCVSEIQGIVAKAPMMVAGTTGLTADQVNMRYELDIESGLAARLVSLASGVPVADDLATRMFSASLGMNFGRLRDLLLEQTMAIVETPYECQHLQELNASANEMATQLNQPMPPFVNNLLGLRAALDDITVKNGQPVDIHGFLALHVVQPEMITGMAQMFVPGLEELDLKPGSAPVKLPPELIPDIPVTLHAALADSAIGIAAGDGFETGLRGFLEAPAAENGVFLSANYDMARMMEMQENMHAGRVYLDDGGMNNAPADMATSLHDSYRSMLGRSQFEMRFSDRGLVIDSQITFR